MVVTNKTLDQRENLRLCITNFVERMPPGAIAFISEIRTFVNEYIRKDGISFRIEDNRTVAEVIRQLIHERAIGALKMDRHGDQFIKGESFDITSCISDVPGKPHLVTVTVYASDNGNPSEETPIQPRILINGIDQSGPIGSYQGMLRTIPPVFGTIVVQFGTIVADNFTETRHL